MLSKLLSCLLFFIFLNILSPIYSLALEPRADCLSGYLTVLAPLSTNLGVLSYCSSHYPVSPVTERTTETVSEYRYITGPGTVTATVISEITTIRTIQSTKIQKLTSTVTRTATTVTVSTYRANAGKREASSTTSTNIPTKTSTTNPLSKASPLTGATTTTAAARTSLQATSTANDKIGGDSLSSFLLQASQYVWSICTYFEGTSTVTSTFTETVRFTKTRTPATATTTIVVTRSNTITTTTTSTSRTTATQRVTATSIVYLTNQCTNYYSCDAANKAAAACGPQGSGCLCFRRVDGKGGECGFGDLQCGPACITSADCTNGDICVLEDCCFFPHCMPINQQVCGVPARPRVLFA